MSKEPRNMQMVKILTTDEVNHFKNKREEQKDSTGYSLREIAINETIKRLDVSDEWSTHVVSVSINNFIKDGRETEEIVILYNLTR